MKKLLLAVFFLVCVCSVMRAQVNLVKLPDTKAKKMIAKYDKLFGNHRKTDGLIISSADLIAAIQSLKVDTVRILYARYLKGDVVNKKKKRTTLLLWVPADPSKAAAEAYYDLGQKGTLCPEPPNCD